VEIAVTAENRNKIWFHPPKFWAATKSMSRDDAAQLLAAVVRMAEKRELDALRRYDFVSIGGDYRRKNLSS